MTTKELLEAFDEQFPAFEGVGAPFPMFSNTPNRNHIRLFLQSAAEKLIAQGREEANKDWEEKIGAEIHTVLEKHRKNTWKQNGAVESLGNVLESARALSSKE
jgi:hypothetical protein